MKNPYASMLALILLTSCSGEKETEKLYVYPDGKVSAPPRSVD